MGGASLAIIAGLLAFVTLFDSVVGVRIDCRIEAIALKQEIRLNKKLDAFRLEVRSSVKESTDLILKLHILISKRRKTGDDMDPVEPLM